MIFQFHEMVSTIFTVQWCKHSKCLIRRDALSVILDHAPERFCKNNLLCFDVVQLNDLRDVDTGARYLENDDFRIVLIFVRVLMILRYVRIFIIHSCF